MPAQWTGELIGKMHINGITSKQLAEEAGLNPKYLSGVLNGRYTSSKAEKKLADAFQRNVQKKKAEGSE